MEPLVLGQALAASHSMLICHGDTGLRDGPASLLPIKTHLLLVTANTHVLPCTRAVTGAQAEPCCASLVPSSPTLSTLATASRVGVQ